MDVYRRDRARLIHVKPSLLPKTVVSSSTTKSSLLSAVCISLIWGRQERPVRVDPARQVNGRACPSRFFEAMTVTRIGYDAIFELGRLRSAKNCSRAIA